MASEKAIYWMAVGLMALVAGNHFMNKIDQKCLNGRALAVVQQLSSEATHSLAMAEAMFSRTSLPWSDAEASGARVQAQLASVQTMVARQEAACARVEAQRARIMALQNMRRVEMRVICPRQRVAIEMPAIQIPQIEIPETPVVVSDDEI